MQVDTRDPLESPPKATVESEDNLSNILGKACDAAASAMFEDIAGAGNAAGGQGTGSDWASETAEADKK